MKDGEADLDERDLFKKACYQIPWARDTLSAFFPAGFVI